MDLEQKFTEVYKNNTFNGVESISGVGSGTEQTKTILAEIPKLLQKYNIKSMVDAPCGDLFWIRELLNEGLLDTYIGVDIVKELIDKNTENYANNGISFQHRNIVTGILSKSDMILCRDCFVHLSFADINKTVQNFKLSGAKYLLTTTFNSRAENQDLGTGFWRPLNLTLHPFCFLLPLEIINEGCTEANGAYADKSLGLWELKDINEIC